MAPSIGIRLTEGKKTASTIEIIVISTEGTTGTTVTASDGQTKTVDATEAGVSVIFTGLTPNTEYSFSATDGLGPLTISTLADEAKFALDSQWEQVINEIKDIKRRLTRLEA